MPGDGQEPVDDFDAAFKSFAVGGDGTGAAPVPDGAAPADPAAEAGVAGDAAAAQPANPDPGASGAGGDDAGAAPSGGDGGDPAAAQPTVETPDATDELVQRLAALVKDAPPAKVADPEPAAAAPQAEPDLYSPEDVAFLTDYEKDWDQVSKGEALKRRGEYRQLVGFVFEQVAQQLKPLLETVDVLSTRTHLGDLRAKVEDYDTVRDNVINWVGEQPAYLQQAYTQVIRAGTADEVADLISRYRQATGAAPAPAQAPAKPAVELSEDARKAAQALAPVNTKRAAIPQDDDSSDFDAAFKRFATQAKT